MSKGLIWATAEELARNRGRVLFLYRQILRSLNSPQLELSLAARLAKKAEARAIFMLGSEERSVHNIADLIDTAEYCLSCLRKGEIPKNVPRVHFFDFVEAHILFASETYSSISEIIQAYSSIQEKEVKDLNNQMNFNHIWKYIKYTELDNSKNANNGLSNFQGTEGFSLICNLLASRG